MQSEYGIPQQPRAGFPMWAFCIIIPCGCGILGVPIVAAILFPVFAQARQKARDISCLSNIKQQNLGLLMYAQDYDDLLPGGANWMTSIVPYTKSEQIFHCPSVAADQPSAFGYSFNNNLSRKATVKIPTPQTTVMTYDSSNLTKNAADAVTSLPNPPRHGGGRGNNIGYADGHARATHAGGPPSAQ